MVKISKFVFLMFLIFVKNARKDIIKSAIWFFFILYKDKMPTDRATIKS